MSNDEREPWRINRTRVNAMAAAGIDNASVAQQLLARETRAGIVIDDVSHLAPVSFAPRYALRLLQTAPGANKATIQVGPCAVPFIVDDIGVNSGTGEMRSLATPAALAGGALTIIETNPNPEVRSVVITGGEIADYTGYVLETSPQNLELVVYPGYVLQFQHGTATTTLDLQITIQEFPGGVNE